jgi:hypothetical protein
MLILLQSLVPFENTEVEACEKNQEYGGDDIIYIAQVDESFRLDENFADKDGEANVDREPGDPGVELEEAHVEG